MNHTLKIILSLIGLIGLGIFLAACREQSAVDPIGSAGSVFFKIEQLRAVDSSEGQLITWLGTHERIGKVARFRIELVIKTPKQGNPFAFGTGALVREDASDSSVLLKEIARALGAKQMPLNDLKTNRLAFTTAVLGRNLSRGVGKDALAGSFTSAPKGDWTAVKVFVADGEGEFFLNLNSKSGQGEFSTKDPEYGDIVVRELAKVL